MAETITRDRVEFVAGSERVMPLALVADDAEVDRRVLAKQLRSSGYRVVTACSGEEAVELFQSSRPDIVLLDILMPTMDGYEACRRIKALTVDDFVPVLFLTSLTQDEGLVRGIESGGDGFLPKPVSQKILKAKVQALHRFRRLHSTVAAQARKLETHRVMMQRELQLGSEMMARITGNEDSLASNLRMIQNAAEAFSGDLLMVAATPSGGQRIFVGDFTGHGLSAAIGAVPAADVFYARTASGVEIPQLVEDLDERLSRLLPSGVFLAAAVVEVTAGERKILVWNGGIPDVLVYREGKNIIHRFPSKHLPLGIGEFTASERTIDVESLLPGDRVFAYSDGVVELSSPAGEMLGQLRLEEAMTGANSGSDIFGRIEHLISTFRDGAPLHDDVTLIELACDGSQGALKTHRKARKEEPPFVAGWSCSFQFDAAAIRGANPLPMIMSQLRDLRLPVEHEQAVYLILAELYTNALDHGLLRLDSALKHEPDGFSAYYKKRTECLSELSRGSISISIRAEQCADCDRLTVQVTDTGSGFSFRGCPLPRDEGDYFSGRGIELLCKVCTSLSYNEQGNSATAVYEMSRVPKECAHV